MGVRDILAAAVGTRNGAKEPALHISPIGYAELWPSGPALRDAPGSTASRALTKGGLRQKLGYFPRDGQVSTWRTLDPEVRHWMARP